jgi:predicted transposase
MNVHLTIKAKLVVTPEARQELKSTMEEFNRACNTLSELAFQQNLHREYDIHHKGYRLIREETASPAQHVINAIAKVAILNGAKSIALRHELPAMGRYFCEYPRKGVNQPEAVRPSAKRRQARNLKPQAPSTARPRA